MLPLISILKTKSFDVRRIAQHELPVLVARDPTHAVSNFKISIAKGQVAKTVCGAG